jgi:hypothetical protein
MDMPYQPRMHYARLAHSPRQQRVLRVLSDGREHSTQAIIREARVCAVNSIVAELRCNGIPVCCRQERRVWYYRLGVTTSMRGAEPIGGASLSMRQLDHDR